MEKKLTIFALSAISLLVSSCSNKEIDNNLPQKGQKALVTFSAKTESSQTTRANFKDIDGNSAAFRWELNDLVGIYASASNSLETLSAIEVYNNKATLQGNITVGDAYIGVYPKSVVKNKINEKSVTINIPATQTIPTTSSTNPKYIDPNALIQVGFTTSNVFEMATPCAYLKFHTGEKSNITWVKIVAYDENNQPYGIAGEVTVTKSETSSITLGTGSTSSNEVTCKYEGGSFPAGCEFAIAIRPGNYKKIVLTASDGTVKEATSMKPEGLSSADPSPLNLQRAYYYPMGNI